jgi:hypothetical protein
LATRFTAHVGLALTLSWVAVLALTGSTDTLLFLAPALLIVIPLVGGHYVGEELIAKLGAARARRPRRRAIRAIRAIPVATRSRLPRGTALIAFSLAKRPPPARLLPQN